MLSEEVLSEIARSAEDADWRAAIDTTLSNPTTANILDLASHERRSGEMQEALAQNTPQQRTRNLNAAMEVGGLLNAGLVDTALDRLKARRRALLENEETTEITDLMIGALRSGEPKRIDQARGIAGLVIAATLGNEAAPVLERLRFGKAPVKPPELGEPPQLASQDDMAAPDRVMSL